MMDETHELRSDKQHPICDANCTCCCWLIRSFSVLLAALAVETDIPTKLLLFLKQMVKLIENLNKYFAQIDENENWSIGFWIWGARTILVVIRQRAVVIAIVNAAWPMAKRWAVAVLQFKWRRKKHPKIKSYERVSVRVSRWFPHLMVSSTIREMYKQKPSIPLSYLLLVLFVSEWFHRWREFSTIGKIVSSLSPLVC